jgi:hypothetical protein
MATSLNGTTPQATYESLLKLGDNSALSASLKRISDGAGNDTPIEISTAAVQFGGSTGMYWDNTNRRLGIGTNAPTTSLQVSTFKSTSINDNGTTVNFAPSYNTYTNGKLAVGVGDGVGRLTVRGSGATSATTAFRVEDNGGNPAFTVTDNRGCNFESLATFNSNVTFRGANDTQSALNMRFVVPGATKTFLINKDYSNSPSASALLQVDTTTQGFLPPRMTTAERDAIVSPATGLKVYNTTLGTTDTYDGTTWQRVGRSTLIKGAGSTSATNALLVQNSAGTDTFRVRDDGQVILGTDTDLRVTSGQQVTFRFAVAVGTLSPPNSSAILQADSTTKGFLPPRMTTTQKNAIATPAAGLVVYDTDTNKLCCYNGTTWNDLF